MIFEPVTTLRIEEVGAGWESLEGEWNQLWRHIPNATPFQTFAWVSACLLALPAENPRVLVAHGSNRIVGLVPLVGEETARLAGGEVSDYQDALVAPGFERMVMGAITDHLLDNPHRWSECLFENIRPESALLFGDFGGGYSDVIEVNEVCPALPLSGNPASRTGLPPAVPAQQQEKVRAARRRAQKAGDVQFETAKAETLNEFLETFATLRAQPRDIQKLHQSAAPGLLEHDVLRMYGLRVSGELRAVYLGFNCAKRAFFYQSAFDPSIADIKPELLLIAHAIEEAVREQAGVFDFLSGGEPKKSAWGAHETHTYCRRITRCS